MNVSLEEARPLVQKLVEGMHERFWNGSMTLHFHEGVLARIDVNRVYRTKSKKPTQPLDTDR